MECVGEVRLAGEDMKGNRERREKGVELSAGDTSLEVLVARVDYVFGMAREVCS